MRRSSGALAAIASICLPGAAIAGPPYFTDDPEPTDLGRWEIYGFATGTLFRHGDEGNGGLDINYGGHRDLQLSAVLSFASSRGSGERREVGVADTELGAKYRFVHQQPGSWHPDISFFPKLEVPTAGRRFGSGKIGASFPVWAQKDVGKWSLFGGGGWTLNPGAGNRNFAFGGLAVTRRLTERLSVGGEIYRQTRDATDSASGTGVRAGASWQVARKWTLMGSAGPQIEHWDRTGRYTFYVALQFHD